ILLLSLLTLIPPMRDDWGSIHLGYSDTGNYYDATQHLIKLRDGKFSSQGREIAALSLPEELYRLIDGSIQIYPRRWLFCKSYFELDQPMGKMFSWIKKNLGLTFDEVRESFTTYVLDNQDILWKDKISLIRASDHTIETAIASYYYPYLPEYDQVSTTASSISLESSETEDEELVVLEESPSISPVLEESVPLPPTN